MTLFVRAANPIWYMVDLTGLALNDQYYAFFLTNDLPYTFQNVYQSPNGTPWANPLQFQPSGTLPNNLYFDPTLTYRIEIRQGPTQNDPLIWLIENFVPGSDVNPNTDALITANNMATNPQFADVYFASPYTFTQASSSTYTVDIGPGWQLVLEGAGTTVLTQGILPGSPGSIPGNPTYYLEINNSGWTSTTLVQKFSNNGAIFGSGAIAISFTASATSAAQTVTTQYVPSTGVSTEVSTQLVTTGNFKVYPGAVNLPASTNTDQGENAFVDIEFSLPGTGVVSLTNVMIVGQSTNLSTGFSKADIPPYAEETYERIVDQEFHVYKKAMLSEPKNSILVGWNFPLNPYQFNPLAGTTATTNKYIADQTILIQQAYVASATGSNLISGKASPANRQGLQLTALTANNQFALLQYISPQSIAPYWEQTVSIAVNARLFTSNSTTVKFKARLIYIAALPNTLSQTDPIASWTAGSDPVAHAGYTLITPPNDPVYTLLTTDNQQYFMFNGIQLPASTNANMTLGILIYTINNMNQTGTPDSIVFSDISLVNNDFALPTQAQTADEVLRQCQFYYEKSYEPGVIAGTASSDTGQLTITQANNGGKMYPACLQLEYKVPKRGLPTITVYNPSTGANNQVLATALSSSGGTYTQSVSAAYAISNYFVSGAGTNRTDYEPASSAADGPTTGDNTAPVTSFVNFHFSANACLGNPTLP